MLPFFKKAENRLKGGNEFHGTGGPLTVTDREPGHTLTDAVVAGMVEYGLPRNPDVNGATQEGAGYFQATTGNSKRWSTATAYLAPARGRGNLVIRPNSMATRVMIEDGKAVGVEYRENGAPRSSRARMEVIVCGGVFNSPQLLQLSGIGPGAMLHAHGIDVMRDMPAVGAHMQDHFYVRHAYKSSPNVTMNELANSLPRQALAYAQYLAFKSGPLASNGVPAGGFARSDSRLERPDLQFNFSPFSYAFRGPKGAVAHQFPGFSISAIHLKPDARGTVTLKSPDPLAAPAIKFNFLQTQYDLQALTTGMRMVRAFTQQPSLAKYVVEEIVPGPRVQTDADFEKAIRENGISNLHPVGTCRMGPEGSESVVDPRLRVHGIGGLRVVDASIMPSVPAGNTNAPTIMIAEKAGSMILEDAR